MLRAALLSVISFTPALGFALKAEVFPLNKVSGPPTFRYSSQEESHGDLVIRTAKFVKGDGELAASEKITFKRHKDHEEITLYELQQLQTNTHVQVTLEGAKYQVELQEGKDHPKHETDSAGADVILPPALLSSMLERWDLWQHDGKWEFKLLLPDLLMTVTMKIEVAERSSEKLKLKLKPAYFYIAAFVSPLYFEWDAKNRKIAKIEGTTLLRDEKNGQFKATTVFESP
jgi:hypothetical protein